jgi:hypothetical protein
MRGKDCCCSMSALVPVPLIAFPEAWASVKPVSELRQGACPVCGEQVDPWPRIA